VDLLSLTGNRLIKINPNTGAVTLNVTGMTPGAVANGYLVASNPDDGYMYVYGKGKSVTTVTAAPKTIAKGASVLIEGTVLDQSPAQLGTPCVSEASMTAQMQYLHLQIIVDGVWHNETITGVPVSLSAIGSDGSAVDIGTVTTNGYYGTFSKEWTPPSQNTYTILASFGGDDSYGSSAGATAFAVGPAPPSPETPETSPPTDLTPMYYAVAAAAIAMIVAVAIATVLMLRKRA